MVKRRNQENKGLPARWRRKHGAFYFRVPPGLEDKWDGKKDFRLGSNLSEAYKVWAERIDRKGVGSTINDLLDRYALEVIPTKAPKTRQSNLFALVKLRAIFGAMSIHDIKPQHVYQYVDRRRDKNGKHARTAAHREIEVLSHAYTKAVEWGWIERHPFKNEVRLKAEKPRERYVEDWEIVECLALPAMRKRGSVKAIQAYIRIKLLTGLRNGDILRLRLSDCRDDGIHVNTNKNKKPVIYTWEPALREAVEMAKSCRPLDIAPWLFCTRDGKCYLNEEKGEASGWKSMWQRFFKRVLAETKITQHFTEHDLRAKVASDAETLAHARALLAHVDERTTRRVYRRKPERVRPLVR